MIPRHQEKQYARVLRGRFCTPKPVQLASQWTEQNLILNEPKIRGPFTFRGRKFLRQLVDCAGPLPPELAGGTDFNVVAGTGIGKTIALIARICYRIGNDPTRALIVKPTGKGPAGAASFSKTRLQPAIKATKCLADKIPTGAERHNFSSNQLMINGSTIDLTGSNSVGQLGENRCDHVEQDEIDKYPPQTETSKEASPVILADERTKSVADARRFKQSTPTLEATGIWAEFKKTDQRRYFMPCPHCFKQVVFSWSKRFTVFPIKGYEAFIKWDDTARKSDGQWDLNKVAKSAHMVCPFCTGKILNSHKLDMIENGCWIATNQNPVPGYIGWHLPSMYSTTQDCDFGQMAKKFLTAKRSLDGVKGFINSDLAEPDVNQSVSVDRIGAATKNIEITGEWLKILSVDYHERAPYFWYMVRAWNGSDAAHGIEYNSCNQWSEIDDVQAKHKIIPQAVIIDCGFSQGEVLQNCADLHKQSRCTLDEAVQDAKPMVNGWTPCKSFGNKRMWRDEETGLYLPYRVNPNLDPFAGTELAHMMRIELLEFKADLFEDMMEKVRKGDTFFKWTIAPEVDTEEYHKHMAGKVRKTKKNNPRDYSWVSRSNNYPDHVHLCELMNFIMAYRLKLISFDAIQTKEDEQELQAVA